MPWFTQIIQNSPSASTYVDPITPIDSLVALFAGLVFLIVVLVLFCGMLMFIQWRNRRL